ncbi:amidohydrolase [Paenibacillus sp. N1-5-1-14]|uniref:amidohydrolase family protein n=1 Tax=Paenibacillus radicibacter TaxID=2972488 RepID=UPI002158E796|nr:amidohydrolase [Paenibacillus radicibacter]MCR8644462.1 amidohydrolase [Paenibacillus radicibacter]
MRQVRPELFEKYKHLGLIDVHNHDADYYMHQGSIETWERYYIDKTVLFGAISEPSAIQSDRLSWEAYEKFPHKFYPFFSGFPMHDKQGLHTIKQNLEKGYYGIGETVAASTYSPLTSKLEWKAQHPMDGNLPEIYQLCVEYHVPILLHIDPPFGEVIDQLEIALDTYPDTSFIFAHANVFNPPRHIEHLLSKHPNLYMDFFAGFAAYDPNNEYPLEDYIPVIKKYPTQFLLSTDSACAQNLDYEKAINAMYEVIDLCQDERIGEQIGRTNFLQLIESQPPTQTQFAIINKYSTTLPESINLHTLNKRQAHELMIKYNLYPRG